MQNATRRRPRTGLTLFGSDLRTGAQLQGSPAQFQAHYEDPTSPFQWTFTRRDLHRLLAAEPGRAITVTNTSPQLRARVLGDFGPACARSELLKTQPPEQSFPFVVE